MKKTSLLLKILGYYILEMRRSSLEDFLNLCLRYGFNCYGIEIDEEERVARVKIGAPQRRNILTACRMWEIRVKTVDRGGLLKRAEKYRRRWGIAVGAVLAVALFILSQSVIWRIDIIGNERLEKQEIIKYLAEQGFSVGGLIRGTNTASVEQRVMIYNEDIAWMSININGTVARVEVREVLDTEITDKKTTPANLISTYDAQIVGMEVYSGFISVKEGDFVRAGELLVSGIYKEGKAPLRFSRASGRVLGKVTRSFEVEIPLVQQKKAQTGEKISKKTLIFFGKPIKFFLNYRNLPISYDIINYVYTFNPFSLGELPISLSVEELLPYEMQEIEISEEEAIEQSYDALRAKIDSEMPDAQILKKSLYGEIVDGKYVLKCTLTAICNIAKQVEFEVVGATSD